MLLLDAARFRCLRPPNGTAGSKTDAKINTSPLLIINLEAALQIRGQCLGATVSFVGGTRPLSSTNPRVDFFLTGDVRRRLVVRRPGTGHYPNRG